MEFIDLKAQYRLIQQDVQARIHAVLEHGQYILGPENQELESKLADFVGARHCINVASGTDALLMALMALDVRAGDEVITSSFSFFATAEVIMLLGAIPVLVDIDATSYNLDPKLLESAITSKTKAVIPVSLYGQCADLDAINAIADRHNLAVIEDGAQSFGATYKGRRSCGLTTVGCTSFFPSKPLGCYGDGGACFTNDDELAERLRSIRVHGQQQRYQHVRVGINGRMDTMQAAIVLAKLELFPEEVKLRQTIGARYSQLLHNVCTTPAIGEGHQSVYAQYTIEVDDRSHVQAVLKASGIPTAIHYPAALHQQPALAGYSSVSPNAEKAARRVLSLPMHPYLAPDDQDRVVAAVQRAINA